MYHSSFLFDTKLIKKHPTLFNRRSLQCIYKLFSLSCCAGSYPRPTNTIFTRTTKDSTNVRQHRIIPVVAATGTLAILVYLKGVHVALPTDTVVSVQTSFSQYCSNIFLLRKLGRILWDWVSVGIWNLWLPHLRSGIICRPGTVCCALSSLERRRFRRFFSTACSIWMCLGS